jgi:hypothetical protein
VQGINDLAAPFLIVFLGEHMGGTPLCDWLPERLDAVSVVTD